MTIHKYIVTGPNDTIEVWLIQNENDKTYSFVNITKGHTCPCRFKSVEDALIDMQRLKKNGKVISYKVIY